MILALTNATLACPVGGVTTGNLLVRDGVVPLLGPEPKIAGHGIEVGDRVVLSLAGSRGDGASRRG